MWRGLGSCSLPVGRSLDLPARPPSAAAPREDACAALELYLRHVHFARGRMGAEDLAEAELADIMRGGGDGAAAVGPQPEGGGRQG